MWSTHRGSEVTLINSSTGRETGEANVSEPNIWGKEDLERRNHELSVLNEIARELNRSVELGEALGFTLSQVAELLGLRTAWIWLRSEEHTSELQSRQYLVCRLLLEKKK